MYAVLVNFLLFNACWFSLVLGAANGLVWPGIALAALFLAWELPRDPAPGRLLSLCALALLFGFLIDGGFVALDLIRYASPAGPLVPYWILGLWITFALALRRCLAWLAGRYSLAAFFGAVGAPLSYAAGARLGAASFPPGDVTLLLMSATWLIATPILVWFAHAAPLPAALAATDEAA